MELTNTHIRYLLTIYRLGQNGSEIASADVARNLKVRKASVSRMLEILMKKELVTKRLYGKVNLTETGIALAQKYALRMQLVADRLTSMDFLLTEDELHEVSCALVQALPEKCFVCKGIAQTTAARERSQDEK